MDKTQETYISLQVLREFAEGKNYLSPPYHTVAFKPTFFVRQ